MWPATQADAAATDATSTDYYGGTVAAVKPGALLALPPSFDVASLESDPGRQLAWTMQSNGGYLVDDTGWSIYQIATEYGTTDEGGEATEVFDDQFLADYGYAFSQPGTSTALPSDAKPASAWMRDVDRIFKSLEVVTNNAPTSIGGGGTPRQPLAPALR